MIPIHKNAFSTSDAVMASFHNERYLMAPHIHQFAELVYIIDGEITVISQGKREVAKKGDMVIIPPFRPHGYYTAAEKTVHIWIFLFSNSLILDLMRNNSNYSFFTNPIFTPSEALRAFVEAKMFDSEEKSVKLEEKGIRKMKSILYPVLEEYFDKASSHVEHQGKRSNSIAETINYLSLHFYEKVTLDDVSKAIGYSKSHISHCLSEFLSISFCDLLNSFRIEYAKNLLLTKDMSVFQISFDCGFSCERSFHRAFKKEVSMTPSEYIAKYSK